MEILTLDLIKQNLRVDDYSRDPQKQREIDKTLTEYANRAEREVYRELNKRYADIIREYGMIPVGIIQAALYYLGKDLSGSLKFELPIVFKQLLNPYKQ